MQYFVNDTSQKRNWNDEKKRPSYEANSEVVVRKITEEELKKFDEFVPEINSQLKWTIRD